MNNKTGLRQKYKVVDLDTGEEVTDFCFVLIPSKDEAAFETLSYYIHMVRIDNPKLAHDLTMKLINRE